ncbi:hypothetical protein HY628_00780, partial [Candidatus Uhrbacteria bacterium]|nr:hypothetical protein [Candidatus Uhrbacteria bacterium]
MFLALVIDTAFFEKFLAASNPAEVMLQLFYSGGWLVFVFVILWGFWRVWVESRQIKWLAKQEWILLAIDVPKETEQTPKAVENVFATLHGSLAFVDRLEKYWFGKLQVRFSFEIISIDGYVQFYVRTFKRLRDLVEAAIYAQYPDAEIAEVEDYTAAVPKIFPAPGWDLFGTELVLSKKSPFPIRTYPYFEDKISGELKDPMAAFLETLAKLRAGEQVWIQIIIAPNDGKKVRLAGEKVVKKLIGAKEKPKKTMMGELGSWGSGVVDQFLGPATKPVAKREDPPT